MNIPIPPRGHWEKVRSGQKVKRPSLPKVFGSLRNIVHDSIIKYRYNSKELTDEELLGLEELGLLTDETKSLIIEKCNNIKVKSQLRNTHNLIIKHQEEMQSRKQEEKKLREMSFPFNRLSNRDIKYTNFHSTLPIHVSESNIKRAYRNMDALFKMIEELEGRISIEPYYGKDVANFCIAQHFFRFELKEESTKKEHKSKLQNGNNENTDRLELVIFNESSYGKDLTQNMKYKDTKDIPLESQLGKIIYDLFVIGNKLSILEEIGDREFYRRREEEKRQQRIEEMKKKELERVSVLEKVVSDWDKAQKIRCFSDSLEKRMATIVDDCQKEKVKQLIKWIQDKADWLDPLMSKEDKILGKKYDIQNILEDLIDKDN